MKRPWQRVDVPRALTETAGDTAKRVAMRLRLSRAATALLTGTESVVDIATRYGFGGSRAVAREFVRQFGVTPQTYRRRGLFTVPDGVRSVAQRHAHVVTAVAPCISFYGRRSGPSRVSRRSPGHGPAHDVRMEIETIDVPEQPALLIRRRIRAEAISHYLAEVLPAVFGYAHRIGAPLAGPPVVRYVDGSSEPTPGWITVEAGVPVAEVFPGDGGIEAARLGGTTVARAVHFGPYERLQDTYQALEIWMGAQGLVSAGPPWEQYLTDPAEEPDVDRWQTVIFWPVTPATASSDGDQRP